MHAWYMYCTVCIDKQMLSSPLIFVAQTEHRKYFFVWFSLLSKEKEGTGGYLYKKFNKFEDILKSTKWKFTLAKLHNV